MIYRPQTEEMPLANESARAVFLHYTKPMGTQKCQYQKVWSVNTRMVKRQPSVRDAQNRRRLQCIPGKEENIRIVYLRFWPKAIHKAMPASSSKS